MKKNLFTLCYGAVLRALAACYPYVWDERCLRAAAEHRSWRPR